MKRQNFTLIELLVVMAIIGILMPSLSKARATAKAFLKRVPLLANLSMLGSLAILFP